MALQQLLSWGTRLQLPQLLQLLRGQREHLQLRLRRWGCGPGYISDHADAGGAWAVVQRGHATSSIVLRGTNTVPQCAA